MATLGEATIDFEGACVSCACVLEADELLVRPKAAGVPSLCFLGLSNRVPTLK